MAFDPKSMFGIQQQIKHNAEDLHSMVNELADWSEEVTAKEKKIGSQGQAKTQKPLPPIRNRVDIRNSLAQSEGQGRQSTAKKGDKKNELFDKVKRDNTPMPDYYKAWDKIGREIEDLDSSDEDTGDATRAKNPKYREENKSQMEMFKPTSGAKPNTSIVVKGARQQQISFAEECKLQGNAYFVSLDYSKAIECYTRCLNNIDKDAARIADPEEMRKLTLSNRSQAYLKLKAHSKAYDDADKALKIDPSHFKSLGRRGTASYYLGRVKQAKIDFISALKSDPENIGFIDYIKKCDERLQKIKSEALEKIERRIMFTDLEEIGFEEHSRRIPVVEMRLDQKVIQELQAKKEQVVNR